MKNGPVGSDTDVAMRVFLDKDPAYIIPRRWIPIAQLPSMLEKEEDILAINSSILVHHH